MISTAGVDVSIETLTDITVWVNGIGNGTFTQPNGFGE